MNVRKIIEEAVDVSLYKSMLRILADYSDFAPATGLSELLRQALENGKKIIPKNKHAIAILGWLFNEGAYEEGQSRALQMPAHAGPNSAAICQKVMNMRFCDLPIEYRPRYRDGKRLVVACWTRGGTTYDKVKDLVGWDGKSGGSWTDIDGKNVDIVLHPMSQTAPVQA